MSAAAAAAAAELASPKRAAAAAAAAAAAELASPKRAAAAAADGHSDKKIKADANGNGTAATAGAGAEAFVSRPAPPSSALAGAAAILRATEEYVKGEMAANDGSHDWQHIDRVRRTALSLAHEQRAIVKAANKADAAADERIDDETLLIVELSALLHDIKDWKYSGSETAGAEAAVEFLQKLAARDGGVHAKLLTATLIARVQHVINFIGFKSELGYKAGAAGAAGAGAGAKPAGPKLTPELGIVQDADRLDAIGAIGIARCFTYGGSKNRALYDPANPPLANHATGISKAQYVALNKANNSASLNHFYEKLLHLKAMMKTDAGRARAAKRHQYMEQFISTFFAEWNGDA